MKFKPGLVGGHCLPVDPYYFSYISEKHNLKTRITLAGRYINDSMVNVVEKKINSDLKKLDKKNKKKILVCGLSYKKDVADLRNSLALKIFKELRKKNNSIKGYDPLIKKSNAKNSSFIYLKKDLIKFDVFVVLTEHSIFKNQFRGLKKKIFIKPL